MSAGPQDCFFCHPSLLSVTVSITAVTDGWTGEDCHIVIPATGAIGRKAQLTNNAVKLHNTTYTASHGEDDEWDSPEFQHKSHWFAFKFGFWQTILLYLSQTQTGWDSLLISGVPVRQALHQTTDQLYITGLVWTTLTTLSLRKCQDTFPPALCSSFIMAILVHHFLIMLLAKPVLLLQWWAKLSGGWGTL